MHQSHIRNLIALHANISKAIRDHETVHIGGGVFQEAELISLKLAVQGTLNNQRKNGSEHDRATIPTFPEVS